MEERESSTTDRIMREYRKGNWTVQETMVLIEAKKMDDERRRMTRKQQHHQHQQQQQQQQTQVSSTTIKPAVGTELRWKWVEEYCWRKGCYRSQNQCNDKWDNLMRDYKKVREYQRSLGSEESTSSEIKKKSYWEMEKGERKDKELPTNMVPQIYQALYDVVERVTAPAPVPVPVAPPLPAATTVASVPVAQPVVVQPALAYYTQSQPTPSLDPQSTSQPYPRLESPPPTKRRKTDEAAVPGPSTTVGPSTSLTSLPIEELGNAISRIADAIRMNEESEEARHREIMSMHERRLRLEESRMEIHRQGIHALADAVKNLASSFLSWANSHRNHGPP